MKRNEDYILGTSDAELDRLRFQHKVWTAQAYQIWQTAGIKAGDRVLDFGCGPGFTSFDLAQVVGPTGHITAHDKSEKFLAYLRQECKHKNIEHLDTLHCDAEEIDLPENSLDAIYSRWLFCWLKHPAEVLTRVAKFVKPGGVIILQDYIDWGAMKVIPRSVIYDAAAAACREQWRLGGSTIDIADIMPTMAEQAGLTIEHFAPICRLGIEGSLEWCWVIGFLHTYLPNLIGTLWSEEKMLQFRTEFPFPPPHPGENRYLYTPSMTDIILRKR